MRKFLKRVVKREYCLPWEWRPAEAGDGAGPNCQDLKKASGGGGKSFENPTNGKVNDFAMLGTLTVVMDSPSLTFSLYFALYELMLNF